MFDKFLFDVRQKFEHTEYVCTTADVWFCKTARFMGMTAHYVSITFYMINEVGG